MPLHRARRTDLTGRAGRPDGVIYRQRTKSFYVGQRLPLGVTPLEPAPAPPTTPARPTAPHEGGDDQP